MKMAAEDNRRGNKTMLRKMAMLVACLTPTLLIAGNPTPRSPEKAAATAKEKGTAATSERLGRTETLSGSITSFDREHKVLIVKASNGVTYNFAVRASARITSGTQPIKLGELASQANKQASVTFVPTGHGNIARFIEISQ
jgi:hypothetical protein